MDLRPIIYFALLPVVFLDALLLIHHRIQKKSKWRAGWLIPGYGIYLYLKDKKDSQ